MHGAGALVLVALAASLSVTSACTPRAMRSDGVYIHLASDVRAELRVRDPSGVTETVCVKPCDDVFPLVRGGAYRVAGAFPPSDSFSLDEEDHAAVRITLQPASDERRIGGAVAISVGVVGLGSAIALTYIGFTTRVPGTVHPGVVFGPIGIIGSVALGSVGIHLVDTSGTRASVRRIPPPASVTLNLVPLPDGVGAASGVRF
jgi:hypothetical protein